MRSRLILWVLLAPAAFAQTRYDALAAELVAPCCWKESLATHRSPAADTARAELRNLVAEGRTAAEIRERFVSKYGARILLTPDGGLGAALFWTPILGALLGTIAGVAALLRWRRTRLAAAPSSPAAFSLDDSERDW